MFFLAALLVTSILSTDSLRFCDSSPNSSLLRIIGGSIAATSEYPWQAALVSYDSTESGMICGATVVDEYWILTAAHCIVSPPEQSYIFTGLTSLSNPQYTHRVERSVVHPGFDANLIIDDIALVKSKQSLYNNGISSVCLVRDDSEFLTPRNEAIVTGFGLHIVSETIFGVTMGVSDVMLKTSLPIIPQRLCQQEWSSLSRGSIMITDKQLCAGSKMHGTGPGDSGGPLLARDKLGRLVQLGITSFGAAGFQGLLDQSTYPGVYTRVSSYIPWMEAVINSGSTPFAFTAFLYTRIFGAF
ncbi:trypsin [Ancylostoma caninum]|uniref:Trypsin n=1 Tax=Ancylostoma caninum TaxID=29170 RepID=A0A368HA69_ANCCA|nr:trypsin [Ancylostoma caninum]